MTALDNPVILVAEDNDADVLTIRRAFRDAGLEYVLHAVSDGDEAIAYLKGEGKYGDRAKYPLPNLLLMDLKMPRQNGFDVLAWLRQQPALSAVRTVVLTTSDQIKDVSRAYALGASSFLVKPLAFAEFRDALFAVQNYWLHLNRNPQVSSAEMQISQSVAPEERASSSA